MHLNTRLMKQAYHEKSGKRRVGFKVKSVVRNAEKKVKTERKGFWASIARLFGLTLFKTKTIAEKWMEKVISPKYKRGGSKLGMKLYKSQVRAVAKIQRKREQGIRVSAIDLMRTGVPKEISQVQA